MRVASILTIGLLSLCANAQSAPSTPPTTLERSDVMNAVNRDIVQASDCYQLSVNHSEKVLVKFTIEGDGHVSSAKATGTHTDTAIGKCVEQNVRAIRFPPFSGKTITMTLPFFFPYHQVRVKPKTQTYERVPAPSKPSTPAVPVFEVTMYSKFFDSQLGPQFTLWVRWSQNGKDEQKKNLGEHSGSVSIPEPPEKNRYVLSGFYGGIHNHFELKQSDTKVVVVSNVGFDGDCGPEGDGCDKRGPKVLFELPTPPDSKVTLNVSDE